MLHFGRRGRENLRELLIQDFALTTDADGLRYMYVSRDERTKNHQLDSNTAAGSMYEIPGQDEMCPVKTFVQYKKMLPPGNTHLFPRPLPTPTKDGYLFSRQSMGHNKLGTMMSELSRKAKLSQVYTNHSLRATSVHVLDSAQIPSRHIMCVTGHTAETSLKTYTGFTDNKTKKTMSHTISKSVGLGVRDSNINPVEPAADTRRVEQTATYNESLGLVSSTLEPLSNSQFETMLSDFNTVDDPVDDILRTMAIPQSVNTINFNSQSQNMQPRALPNPVISGANASDTINYNFFNGQ